MHKLTDISLNRIVQSCLVQSENGFRLEKHPTGLSCAFGKDEAEAWMHARREHLAQLQEKLAASGERAVLFVLQGMDAAGKDSMIRSVMSGINPQGVKVVSFKAPSAKEIAHDFLWRIHLEMPMRGQIGIFNRSHYEDVLVARVHADNLDAKGLEGTPNAEIFWQNRLEDIRNFETYLYRQGTVVIKIMLHVSKEKQQQRLLKRLDTPLKQWKFDVSDLTERRYWALYQQAYAEAIKATARDISPWYVVPSDHKWLSRLIVSEALIAALEKVNPQAPAPAPDMIAKLPELRKALRGS